MLFFGHDVGELLQVDRWRSGSKKQIVIQDLFQRLDDILYKLSKIIQSKMYILDLKTLHVIVPMNCPRTPIYLSSLLSIRQKADEVAERSIRSRYQVRMTNELQTITIIRI